MTVARHDTVDCLIVGAGAAGAAFAWRLASAGIAVTCLEQGDWADYSALPSSGNGWFSAGLHNCGFEVTGVDHSESGLRLATRRYPDLRFLRQDVMDELDPSLVGRFDAVIAVDTIDHLPLPRRLIHTALVALKPGGLLIVTSAYHGYVKNLLLALRGGFDEHLDPLVDHGRVKFFSRATLLALLAEFGLCEVRFQSVGRFPLLARAMLVSARVAK